MAAEKAEGIYHDNLILKLELTSPHFKSGKEVEAYEMVVMTHKEDGVKTLAINEFPEMNEEKIEEFWIEKVKEKRMQKEESFRKLEMEDLLLRSQPFVDNETGENESNFPHSEIKDIVNKLDTTELLSFRHRLSENLQARLPEKLLNEEVELADLSLFQLYLCSIRETPYNNATDFQVYRSRQILNASMQQIKKNSVLISKQKDEL